MPGVTVVETSAALAEAATLGEFFHVTVGPREGAWLKLEALTEPAILLARVAATESAIGTAAGLAPGRLAPRVAASTVSLGIFARVMAPPLGCLLTSGVLPHLSPRSLWWQPQLGGVVPFAADPTVGSKPGGGAAAAYADIVLVGLVEPLIAAFRKVGVSPVVLLGNVASALGGAAHMIATARPDLASTSWTLVGRLLAEPMLAGTATIEADGRSLRRRSCCLFYRVPGGGYCGDCVLRERGTVSR